MFQLENVTVSYGNRLALDAGNLLFSARSTTALMGPNGSGKTTLLDLLAGLHHPTTGRIRRSPSVSVAYIGQHQHQHSRESRNVTMRHVDKVSFPGGHETTQATRPSGTR